MRKRELLEILKQRKKECEKHRKQFENQLEELRKENELGFDREILGAIQHPIGYLTGAMSEIDNTIGLINTTLKDYNKEKRLIKKQEKKQKKYLESFVNKKKKKKMDSAQPVTRNKFKRGESAI